MPGIGLAYFVGKVFSTYRKAPFFGRQEPDRKLLLKLVDTEDDLRDAAALHNFTCGYRLAYGIHRELAEEPAYSFTKEEEERAGRKVQTDGEIDAETDNT